MAALSSCHVVHHGYSGERQITPGTVLLSPSSPIGHIEGSKKAFFFFFGLLRLNGGSGAEYADRLGERYMAGEDFAGITHLDIRERYSALDVIVRIFTLGLFSMRTVDVEGEIHRRTSGVLR